MNTSVVDGNESAGQVEGILSHHAPIGETAVHEAIAEFHVTPATIDNDTRLSSAGETEAMWSARPARGSVIRSLQRHFVEERGRREAALFRGEGANSHTRRDLLTGDWTIYAPQRDQRPNEFESAEVAPAAQTHGLQSDRGIDEHDVNCPFCAGAEQETPQAVWTAKLCDQPSTPSDNSTTRFARPQVEIVDGEQPLWSVRVVPNKFPAVTSNQSPRFGQVDRHDLFPINDLTGGHEVMIESDSHAESVLQQDPALIYLVMLAYRDRIRYWRDIPGVNFISIFKNCGPEAGASLRHSHSQLIATSLMPQHVRSSLMRCENHRARTGCSLGCDLLRAELEEKSRVIDRTDAFAAFCPFASRFPGLVRITSVDHQPHFDAISEASLDQLASFLFRVLSWVDQAFPGKAYNYILNTCPPGARQPDAFQWHLDVFPRISKTAGFEWSSDCMINSLLPESAASRYRDIARKHDPRNVLAVR